MRVYSSNYIKLFKKGLIFLFLLVIFDFSIGKTLKKLYFSQNSGNLYKATYAIEHSDEEIIVLGPSTASHHYIPSIIEDSLGMSCYNAGRDGSGLFYSLAIQQAILNRYTPKLFIVDIRPSLLTNNFDDYGRLANLLPYYEDHKEMRSIIELRGPFEKYKLVSRIYPYNSMLLVILKGIFFNNIDGGFNGYEPLNGIINSVIEKEIMISDSTFVDIKIKTLRNIIQNAKNAGSEIVLVGSPSYNYNAHKSYFKLIDKIRNEYSIEYFSFIHSIKISKEAKYFKDRGHLNHTGSIIYTSEVATTIFKSGILTNSN